MKSTSTQWNHNRGHYTETFTFSKGVSSCLKNTFTRDTGGAFSKTACVN